MGAMGASAPVSGVDIDELPQSNRERSVPRRLVTGRPCRVDATSAIDDRAVDGE
jgi:hypothetical protein